MPNLMRWWKLRYMTRSRRDFLWSTRRRARRHRPRAVARRGRRDSRFAEAAAEFNGGLHHRRQGQARHPAVHERRRQPDGHVRLQARTRTSGTASRSTPAPARSVEGVTSTPGNLMKSPFPFKQHGQCGRWVSSRLPAPRRRKSIAWRSSWRSRRRSNVHGPASYMMNTGFILPGFPCMGAWLSLRPRPAHRQPADVRRAAGRPRPAVQPEGQLRRRASCRSRTQGTILNAERQPADPRPRAVAEGAVRHARRGRAMRSTCSAR